MFLLHWICIPLICYSVLVNVLKSRFVYGLKGRGRWGTVIFLCVGRTIAGGCRRAAKWTRTIAKPFYNTVSCPCNGARSFYIVTLRARLFSLFRRRTVFRRVCGAGRAWRSGGSIRGLAASVSRGRWLRGGRR